MTTSFIEDRVNNALTVVEYLLDSEDSNIMSILNKSHKNDSKQCLRSELTDLHARIINFLADLELGRYETNIDIAFAINNRLIDGYVNFITLFKELGGELDTNKILTRVRTGAFLANNRSKRAGVQNVKEIRNY